jgi:hypothetical protein
MIGSAAGNAMGLQMARTKFDMKALAVRRHSTSKTAIAKASVKARFENWVRDQERHATDDKFAWQMVKDHPVLKNTESV